MSSDTEVRIFPDLPSLSRAAAEEFITRAGEAIQSRGLFTVALSGGSTPRTLYSLLGGEAHFRDRVAWEKVHFFFTDERLVPPDHPDSNYRMAYRALLAKIPSPPSNAHRMATEMAQADGVAEDCEQSLKQFFRLEPGEVPRFDLVLLGLGSDGHTASLFPKSEALKETKQLAVAAWVEVLQAERITLTLPVLNQAAVVMFLVIGAEKAEALRDLLEGPEDPALHPAQAVRPTGGRRLFFVDREAARLLQAHR